MLGVLASLGTFAFSVLLLNSSRSSIKSSCRNDVASRSPKDMLESFPNFDTKEIRTFSLSLPNLTSFPYCQLTRLNLMGLLRSAHVWLITNSILFCWLFAIRDQRKKEGFIGSCLKERMKTIFYPITSPPKLL